MGSAAWLWYSWEPASVWVKGRKLAVNVMFSFGGMPGARAEAWEVQGTGLDGW